MALVLVVAACLHQPKAHVEGDTGAQVGEPGDTVADVGDTEPEPGDTDAGVNEVDTGGADTDTSPVEDTDAESYAGELSGVSQ